MARLGPVVVLVALGALVGCVPPSGPLTVTPTPALSNAGDTQAFGRAEETFLRTLGATDPRLSRRVGSSPSEQDQDELERRLQTRQPGERQGGLVGSVLDPFALGARRSEGKFAYERFSETIPTGRRSPAERTELELARRLQATEAARASLEEDLTVYGGDLLVAAAMNLADAEKPEVASARDAWFAERLGDVNDAFATKKTSSAHRRELSDALDPIERELTVDRFPRAFAALAKLRETTGEARMMGEAPLPEPSAASAATLSNALVVLGEDRTPNELTSVLAAAETALAAKAKEALAALSDRDADKARAAAGKRIALRASCKQSVRESLVRSLPASHEREAGCLAAHALAEAKTPQELAEAWVLVHDRAAIALWCATFHAARAALDVARGKATMLSLAEEATKSALLRRAALRPAVSLGPGLVAALLVKGGAADLARATRLVAFGDGDLASMRSFMDAHP
jgi:hypothetical protein